MRQFSFGKLTFYRHFYSVSAPRFPLNSWVRGQATSGEALGETALLVFTTLADSSSATYTGRTIWTAVFPT
jgi:hypothetical protein